MAQGGDPKDKKAVVSKAFSNDTGDIVSKKKVELKLSNKGSMLDALPKKPSKEDFEQKATEVNDTLNAYGVRASDLALRFKRTLDDKTLPQNKNPFQQAAESELLTNLVQLSVDMNTDEHEQEGMGSVGLSALLLKTVLIQRDRINDLEYKLSLLDKQVKELKTAALTPPGA
jgi:hypothetical protein